MAGTSEISQIFLVVESVRLVSCNQTDQTNQIDRMNKNQGGDYCFTSGGMALIISAASSFATSFKFGR